MVEWIDLIVLIVGVVGVVCRSLDCTRWRGKAKIVKRKGIRGFGKVGKFVGSKRIVVDRVKIIGGVGVGRLIVPVVFVVVDGVVRPPFDNETTLLD